MTGERKNIDNLFRDGLNGYGQRPPAQAWNRLDQSLDAARNKRRALVLRLAAASILILMAFGAGYFYATQLRQPADVAKEALKEIPQDRPGLTEEKQVPATDREHAPSTPAQKDTQDPTARETKAIPNEAIAPVRQESLAMEQEAVYPGESTIPAAEMMMPADRKVTPPVPSMAILDLESLDLPVHEAHPVEMGGYAKKPVNLESLQYYPEDYDLRNEPKSTSWALGAQFAPIYSYREISANYGVNVSGNQQDVVDLNEVEEGLLSYSGGVDVGYAFSKRWSMQSGVYFSRIGQVNNDALEFKQSKDEFLLFGIATSTGNINVAFERVPQNVRKFNAPKDSIGTGALSDVKVIQNFDLFEVPLLIRYRFLDRRFSMNLTGGLSPAYLLANNTYLEMDENKYDVGDAGNLNSMIVNTSLGMGFAYSVTRKLSLNFEPTFKYALNPINSNSNISYHPYSLTWFTGIRLRID